MRPPPLLTSTPSPHIKSRCICLFRVLNLVPSCESCQDANVASLVRYFVEKHNLRVNEPGRLGTVIHSILQVSSLAPISLPLRISSIFSFFTTNKDLVETFEKSSYLGTDFSRPGVSNHTLPLVFNHEKIFEAEKKRIKHVVQRRRRNTNPSSPN